MCRPSRKPKLSHCKTLHFLLPFPLGFFFFFFFSLSRYNSLCLAKCMFCADADGAAETVRSGEGGLFALMHLLRVSELPHLFRPLSPSPFLSPFPPSVSFSVRLSVCLVSLSLPSSLPCTRSSHSRIAPLPPGLCYSHVCPPFVYPPSPPSLGFLPVTPPPSQPATISSTRSSLPALPVSGIGSRWVF